MKFDDLIFGSEPNCLISNKCKRHFQRLLKQLEEKELSEEQLQVYLENVIWPKGCASTFPPVCGEFCAQIIAARCLGTILATISLRELVSQPTSA